MPYKNSKVGLRVGWSILFMKLLLMKSLNIYNLSSLLLVTAKHFLPALANLMRPWSSTSVASTTHHQTFKKISSVRDWRSTPTYCQLQSHSDLACQGLTRQPSTLHHTLKHVIAYQVSNNNNNNKWRWRLRTAAASNCT